MTTQDDDHVTTTTAAVADVALSPRAAHDVVTFLHAIGRLKTTPRTGWLDMGLRDVESVSDHMYRVAMLCMMCPDAQLDRHRLLQLALCHDVGECIIGDISPRMGVAAAEKRRRETAAVASLAALLASSPDATFRDDMRARFDEYEAQATAEARLVRDMDVLEMVVQAHQYEHAHPGVDLDSFFASGKAIAHPWPRAIYTALCRTRARDGAAAPTLPHEQPDNDTTTTTTTTTTSAL